MKTRLPSKASNDKYYVKYIPSICNNLKDIITNYTPNLIDLEMNDNYIIDKKDWKITNNNECLNIPNEYIIQNISLTNNNYLIKNGYYKITGKIWKPKYFEEFNEPISSYNNKIILYEIGNDKNLSSLCPYALYPSSNIINKKINDNYYIDKTDGNIIKNICNNLKSGQIIKDTETKKYYIIPENNNLYKLDNNIECQLPFDFYYGNSKICCLKKSDNINSCLNNFDYNNQSELKNNICMIDSPMEYIYNNKNIIIPECDIKKQGIFEEPKIDKNEKIIVKLIAKNIKDANKICKNLNIPPFENITKIINLNQDSKYFVDTEISTKCPLFPKKGELAINISESDDNKNIIKNGIYIITNNIYKELNNKQIIESFNNLISNNNNIMNKEMSNNSSSKKKNVNICPEKKINYIFKNIDSKYVNNEKLIYYNSIANNEKQTINALNKADNIINKNINIKKEKINLYNSNLLNKSQKINYLKDKIIFNNKLIKILNIILFIIIFILFILIIFYNYKDNKYIKNIKFFKP